MYLIDFIHPITGELKDKLAGLDRSGHGVVGGERVGHRLTGRGFLPLHALPGPLRSTPLGTGSTLRQEHCLNERHC